VTEFAEENLGGKEVVVAMTMMMGVKLGH